MQKQQIGSAVPNYYGILRVIQGPKSLLKALRSFAVQTQRKPLQCYWTRWQRRSQQQRETLVSTSCRQAILCWAQAYYGVIRPHACPMHGSQAVIYFEFTLVIGLWCSSKGRQTSVMQVLQALGCPRTKQNAPLFQTLLRYEEGASQRVCHSTPWLPHFFT